MSRGRNRGRRRSRSRSRSRGRGRSRSRSRSRSRRRSRGKSRSRSRSRRRRRSRSSCLVGLAVTHHLLKYPASQLVLAREPLLLIFTLHIQCHAVQCSIEVQCSPVQTKIVQGNTACLAPL